MMMLLRETVDGRRKNIILCSPKSSCGGFSEQLIVNHRRAFFVPEILLTQGKVAIVDDEDYEFLVQWKWHYTHCGYGTRNTGSGPKKRTRIYMHRAVLERMLGGPIPAGMQVDHITGNKLDNRRENLRLVTYRENIMNRAGHSGSLSGYKGVGWHAETKKWQASIMLEGKQRYLGIFALAEDAARAYDAKAKELFGKFARLNFPGE